ncbi:hypothetical protein DAPPUDRAFT_107725 [Daphnia pulex]|uniref:FAM193 C-terminal domain-containing protein n=1 Tax=Daphnia pulex TaxID=6669 RepID=E9GY12_DAPPU|nr:hypothetical protein DAPPUDRAFT_107725 [Daphnia pulex]|eukprot:EFX75642.1 hypothetical protein DAPPUDRAFT_107725 [Daphnia pulex]
MPKDVEEKSSSSNSLVQSIDNNEEDLDEEGCCRCCHCGSGQEDVKNQNYLKMREHLQQRLKAKNLSHSACDSSTGSRSSSSNCNIDGYAELDCLVKYIEGHKAPQKIGPHNPKRAAKKARQKEKKLEQKKAEELATKQALKKPTPTSVPSKVSQDRVPNGMVRITHNPLTNSAVITPLYGPLEPNPSYLQQPLGLSQPVKMAPPSNPVSIDPPRPNPVVIPNAGSNSVQQQQTSVSGLASSPSTSSQPQQMVTIRRVMQPNLSEPVVTVTLKGETPDNDRVLFTLINGQVLPTDKPTTSSSLAVNSTLPSPGSTMPSSRKVEPVSDSTPTQSRKKQKKQEKKKQKKLLLKAANNTESIAQSPKIDQMQKIVTPQYPSQQQDFTLDNFRLPPGITLTRVQGSLGGLAAPNVIVVDTRKIQQQPTIPQQQPRVVQTCSVGVQTGEDDGDEELFPNGVVLNKQQRKKLRRREKLQEEQAILNQLADLQLDPSSKKVNDSGKKNGTVSTKLLANQVKSVPSQAAGRGKPTNAANAKSTTSSGTCTTGGKSSSKKKKKSRPSASAQASEDKWEENVFVPKSDLDLEGGDLDDDERELEAFKRFCFNTVPPERKEKVRIHLNVKDIFGKKSNGLQMTSCK